MPLCNFEYQLDLPVGVSTDEDAVLWDLQCVLCCLGQGVGLACPPGSYQQERGQALVSGRSDAPNGRPLLLVKFLTHSLAKLHAGMNLHNKLIQMLHINLISFVFKYQRVYSVWTSRPSVTYSSEYQGEDGILGGGGNTRSRVGS